MSDKTEVELVIRSKSGKDRVVQRVRGVRYEREGKLFFHYKEPEGEMGRVSTTLKVEPDYIRILRQGDIRSEQQFGLGRKLGGYYDTPHGRFELDTETKKLRVELNQGLGKLAWTYDLYVSGERTGRYELDIEIKAVSL